jgi:hypothetical protein
MILLFNGDALGDGPISTPVVTIVVRGVIAMSVFLEIARFAVVGYSDGMKTMCPTVTPHVTKFGKLFVLSSACPTAASSVGVVIFVCGFDMLGEEGNSVVKQLELGRHCVDLGILRTYVSWMFASASLLVMDVLASFAMYSLISSPMSAMLFALSYSLRLAVPPLLF